MEGHVFDINLITFGSGSFDVIIGVVRTTQGTPGQRELYKLTIKNRYPLPRIDDQFDQLRKLYAKFFSVKSGKRSTVFGHVINGNGIHVDPSKIEAVKNWKAPRTSTEVHSFLGLAGYYCSQKELNMRQRHWIELFSDCDYEICYLPDKANAVADAICRKERVKPKRVRVMNMTLQSSIKDMILRLRRRLWMSLHDCRKSMQDVLGTRLNMSTAYHPQTDGQSKRTIQTLEDMLRACVWDFGISWDVHLSLVEFSYNNSYHSSVRFALFKALYDRMCCSPIMWAKVGEGYLTGPELVQETTEKILQIKDRLKAARDRHKSYAYKGGSL
nr:putative reverse transcriptase domain-containing protein [Tanacetum cinerariifolium]GEY52381.1 putative reverse transcriptase domain-containing protein [Tanacetum cinerariifolium]